MNTTAKIGSSIIVNFVVQEAAGAGFNEDTSAPSGCIVVNFVIVDGGCAAVVNTATVVAGPGVVVVDAVIANEGAGAAADEDAGAVAGQAAVADVKAFEDGAAAGDFDDTAVVLTVQYGGVYQRVGRSAPVGVVVAAADGDALADGEDGGNASVGSSGYADFGAIGGLVYGFLQRAWIRLAASCAAAIGRYITNRPCLQGRQGIHLAKQSQEEQRRQKRGQAKRE